MCTTFDFKMSICIEKEYIEEKNKHFFVVFAIFCYYIVKLLL